MKYLVIISLLFCTSLKGEDTTNIQLAGIKMRQAITCQIAAGGFAGLSLYAFSMGDPTSGKVLLFSSAALQIASITLHYKASELLIRPMGVVYKF